MSSKKWIFFLVLSISAQPLNINQFKINFFEQSKKLYYVNAMNNENGDIYFEFWGEESSTRYFIGKSFLTEEVLKINGNEICEIKANSNWNYHESIIIKYNDDINILSMNSKNIDYINLKDEFISSKLTTELIGNHNGLPSYKSCLIKLQDGNYLSSIILKDTFYHNIYMTIFNVASNNINSFETIKQKSTLIDYTNSTTCFQTESSYIQCSFNALTFFNSDSFSVGIYDLNLQEKETVHFGYFHDYSFTKIFHIKGEIGAYIFFDKDDNDVPKLFIKKLNDNKNNLDNVLSSVDYIVLNNNGRYELNCGLFFSDAIKINDLKFVVFLTIKNDVNDILICLCDFNDNYSSIRIRYYSLNMENINIKIEVNLKAFVFKDYFGLLFYDSISEYPGYLFFNYPKIISESKIEYRKIKFEIVKNPPFSTFTFSEHLELINIIFTGQIKIKIINFPSSSISSIKIKTSTEDISQGNIIDFNETLIFEPNITDIIPGIYILQFYPIFVENESSKELYGNNQEGDFENIEIITNSIFYLIYIVKCDNNKLLYNKNNNENYCLDSCIYDSKTLYQDETENFCYDNCSEAINGNIYKFNNKCVSHCPQNYFLDENNECILNETLSETISISDREINISSKISDNLIINIDNNLEECNVNEEALINDYKIKGGTIEFKELKECSLIYYCYSSNSDISQLMDSNPHLIFIDFKECKNSLINKNIIEENSEILILGKQKLIPPKKSLMENFEYEIYNINGNKIEDISPCLTSKLDISTPINNKKDLDTAISLFEQGYDIFNLSSSFYYDICLSANINGNDLTLNLRQNEIMPKNNSICSENCVYNGVDLTTKRISCLCNFNYTQKNGANKVNNKEKVDENFFSYIFGMINYKIIVCHKLLLNKENFDYNFGFYVGIGILIIIIILCIIYYCKGKKSIRIQYLHYAPELNNDLLSINLNNNSKRVAHNIFNEINRNNILNMERNNIKATKTFINKKKRFKYTFNLNRINEENIQNINLIKKENIKHINKININSDTDKKNSPHFENSNEYIIRITKNNNTKNMEQINNKKEHNDDKIDYNELTYFQAIKKDERNLAQIFISYFRNKFEIIQILFFPKEFSHKSLTLSLYLYELLLDLSFNALLFSDEVISQKYYNNGNLLFITSQILSISSNIISCFIVYITSNLINYYSTLEAAKQETKSQKKFYDIFIRISWFIYLKITIFYIIIFISGIFCAYYLFIFCAIFKKIQKNLFLNYLIGILWSLLYKVIASILSTILRKISIYGKFKRLYFVSKYIDENI